MTLEDYHELGNVDAALAAHRLRTAVDARREALDARLNLLAAQHLAKLAPDRPAETGALLEAARPAAETADGRASALRDLAGINDSAYPWARWIEGGDGTVDAPYKSQLGQWEELYVQRADQATHASAYGVDPSTAAYQRASAEARVLAIRDLIAELQPKAADQAKTAAGTTGRRGAAQDPPA